MKSLFLRLQTVLCIIVIFLSTAAWNVPIHKKPNNVESRITYNGRQDQWVVFTVNASKLPARSAFRILNEEGDVLYEEVVKTDHLLKRYKIVLEGLHKVQFEIVNKQVVFHQAFDIHTQIEQKVIVTEVQQ